MVCGLGRIMLLWRDEAHNKPAVVFQYHSLGLKP